MWPRTETGFGSADESALPPAATGSERALAERAEKNEVAMNCLLSIFIIGLSQVFLKI